MAFRVPPNRGQILYPAVFHLRCDAAMKQAIIAHGGAGWVRSIVRANIAAPFTAHREAGAFAEERSKSRGPRRSGPKRRRVSLDKRKRRIVK